MCNALYNARSEAMVSVANFHSVSVMDRPPSLKSPMRPLLHCEAERAQAHQTLLPLVQNPQCEPQVSLRTAPYDTRPASTELLMSAPL